MNFNNRARRFEEQIALLRRLWTEPVVDLRGPLRARSTAAGINPLPVQRPIPIWIGGSAEPALKRAAALGGRLLPAAPAGRRLGGDARARCAAGADEAGRDPATASASRRGSTPAPGTPDDWRPPRRRVARPGRHAHLGQHDGRRPRRAGRSHRAARPGASCRALTSLAPRRPTRHRVACDCPRACQSRRCGFWDGCRGAIHRARLPRHPTWAR